MNGPGRETPRLWQQLTARERKWAQKDLGPQLDLSASFYVRGEKWEQAPIGERRHEIVETLEPAVRAAEQFAAGKETPLEKTMRLALEAAGCKSETEFKRLPKKEQNAFLAQAAGAQRPEAIAAAAKAGEGFRMIPRKQIERSHTNRDEFDDDEMGRMVDSVKEHGIIEPLIVRPIKYEVRPFAGDRYMLVRVCGDSVEEGLKINIPAEDGDEEIRLANATRPLFEIVAGERRYIAGGRAELAELPCIVRNLDNRAALKLQLTENLLREDLRPLDEARGYKQMQEVGFTMEEIEAAVSKKRATIYAKMALLELPAEAKTALEQGRISASQAELVTSIDDPEQQKRFTAEIAKPVADYKHGQQIERPQTFRESKALADEIKAAIEKEKKWQAETAEYRGKGYKVLTLKQSEGCFNYGTLRAGYVMASAACDLDEKGRTWKSLLGAHAPTVIVAKKSSSYDGVAGPRLLYAREAAEKALSAAGHAVLTAAEKTESKAAAAKREEEERKAKEAVKLAADGEKIGRLVTAAEARDMTADGWRLILNAISRNSDAKHVVTRRSIPMDPKKGEWEKYESALETFAAKLDGRKLRGLVLELLLWDYHGADEETLAAAAKIYGVKFQALRHTTAGRKRGQG